jgi:hypothetical protein
MSDVKVGEEADQGSVGGSEAAGQVASEIGDGEAQALCRARSDHIEHGFSLGEIEASVEKRPQRELAWFGVPRPGLKHDAQGFPQGDRSAMAREFDRVFLCVGVGRGHPAEQHLVDRRAAGWVDDRAIEQAVALGGGEVDGRGPPSASTENVSGDPCGVGSTDANDTDPTFTGGRGDCRYSSAIEHGGHRDVRYIALGRYLWTSGPPCNELTTEGWRRGFEDDRQRDFGIHRRETAHCPHRDRSRRRSTARLGDLDRAR